MGLSTVALPSGYFSAAWSTRCLGIWAFLLVNKGWVKQEPISGPGRDPPMITVPREALGLILRALGIC